MWAQCGNAALQLQQTIALHGGNLSLLLTFGTRLMKAFPRFPKIRSFLCISEKKDYKCLKAKSVKDHLQMSVFLLINRN